MEKVEFKCLKQFSTVGYGNGKAGGKIVLPTDVGLQMCDAGLVELIDEPKKEAAPKKEVSQKKSSKKDV